MPSSVGIQRVYAGLGGLLEEPTRAYQIVMGSSGSVRTGSIFGCLGYRMLGSLGDLARQLTNGAFWHLLWLALGVLSGTLTRLTTSTA